MTNSVYSKFKEFYNTNKADLFVGVLIPLLIPVIAFSVDILTNIVADKYIQLLGMENISFISTNSSQVQNKFSSSILLAASSVVYVLCMAPFLLRFFYHYNRNDFSLGKNKEYRVRNASLLFILFPCFSFIIALILNSRISLFLIVTSYFSIALIAYLKMVSKRSDLHNGFYSTNLDDFLKYIVLAFSYATYIMVTFIPFYFIFRFVIEYYSQNNIGTGTDYEIIAIAFLLIFIYGLLYGARTALHSISQYMADIILAFLIIIGLYFFAPSILILPIVEITGIKDKDAYNYKIKSDDFDSDLKANVTSLWNYGLDAKSINCHDKVNNTSCSLFMSKLENSDYLIVKLKIIYRDSEQVIICPPNFELIKYTKTENDKTQKLINIELCSIMDSNKILPSTKSSNYLESNEKFENFYVDTNAYLDRTKEKIR